jgi:hypothetical protein
MKGVAAQAWRSRDFPSPAAFVTGCDRKRTAWFDAIDQSLIDISSTGA